jgi:hypothetical protein
MTKEQKLAALTYTIVYLYFAGVIAGWIGMAVNANKWITIMVTFLFVSLLTVSYNVARLQNSLNFVDAKYMNSINLLVEAIGIQSRRVIDINNLIIKALGQKAKPEIH